MTDEQARSQAPYTPAEFHAAVLAARPHTAVFDCDGTLWSGDAGYGFLLWTLEQGLVTAARRAWIEERYGLYEKGFVDEATICGEMVQLYAGLPESTVRAAAQTYIRTLIRPTIFSELLTLIDALRERGTELWAVSSTFNLVVEAAVWEDERFCIPAARILAAEVAIEAGILTGHLLAVPTDEAKASALVAAGLGAPDVVFGNSIHDAAMLAIARHAFPVNPSAALTALAAERGWRCFAPQRLSQC